MRTKAIIVQGVGALERVLEALAPELIASTDEEILEAAKDLGMDPTMQRSAAFAGLKYFATPQLSEFFDRSLPPVQVETRQGSKRSKPVRKR